MPYDRSYDLDRIHYTVDPKTGQGTGTAWFNDGNSCLVRTRMTLSGERKIRLLTVDGEIPICSPPRMEAVWRWLEAKYPLSQTSADPSSGNGGGVA